MAQSDALEYIRNLMKRDLKPVNPETKIMIRLYDRMSTEQNAKPKYIQHRQKLKFESMKISEALEKRGGMLLPNEIELKSKVPLNIIETALKEIGLEEE